MKKKSCRSEREDNPQAKDTAEYSNVLRGEKKVEQRESNILSDEAFDESKLLKSEGSCELGWISTSGKCSYVGSFFFTSTFVNVPTAV